MEITRQRLLRWSGLAALLAGLIFAGIQPIHPADVVASVTTVTWGIVVTLKFLMCFLFLIGIAGLYLRQAEEAGWLGLVGFVLFATSWALQSGFVFTEWLVLPQLAASEPNFVDSLLGISSGASPTVDVGALSPVYTTVGILYLIGGIVFGIATVRARVLPRWPAILLAVTALLTPAAILLPHAIQRLAAIPMGIAFICLGYALWSEKHAAAA
jgi:hypothetical protein